MQRLQEEYDRWHARPEYGDDPREERLLQWALRLLRVRPGQRVLDVACGRGGFLEQARAHGLAVTGIDVSRVAVEQAQRRLPGADIAVGNGEDLRFPDGGFDRVVCLGSLEHFEDPARGAAEMNRVLADDGLALVYVPNLFFLGHLYFGLRHGTQPSEADQDFSEVFLSRQGWIDLLSRSGLVVESVHKWNYVYASPKVPAPVMRAWNVLSPLVPTNASYSFGFVCRRGTRDPEGA